MLLGLLWCVWGLSILAGTGPHQDPAYIARVPDLLRGWGWIGTGALAVVGSFVRRDSAFFGVLMLMPLFRVGSTVIVFWGDWQGQVLTITWYALLALVVWHSGGISESAGWAYRHSRRRLCGPHG